jgi:hypothetical protein
MCRESEQIPAEMRRGVVAKRIAILIVGILTLPTLLAQEANPYRPKRQDDMEISKEIGAATGIRPRRPAPL